MNRRRWIQSLAGVLGFGVVGLVSCRTLPTAEPTDMPMPDITPTTIDYVDADAFDALFEAVLVSQDPVIIIRTDRQKPDWDSRLNAWIAAWSRSGKSRGRTVRGQTPLSGVRIDGESVREFRLLVNGLLDRVEELAQSSSGWWLEERERSRRVSLLKPYNLRFHMSEEKKIHLVFFHGSYSVYYPRFVQVLTRAQTMPAEEWTRTVECSRCTKKAEGKEVPGKLTSRGSEK